MHEGNHPGCDEIIRHSVHTTNESNWTFGTVRPPYVVGTANRWVQGCYEQVPYFTRVPAILPCRSAVPKCCTHFLWVRLGTGCTQVYPWVQQSRKKVSASDNHGYRHANSSHIMVVRSKYCACGERGYHESNSNCWRKTSADQGLAA